MRINDKHGLKPETASLVVDWRALEVELGSLGLKLNDLATRDGRPDQSSMDDLNRRYEEISNQFLDLKDKTYDQIIETEEAVADVATEGKVVSGIKDAAETVKEKASEITDNLSTTVEAAGGLIKEKAAEIDARARAGGKVVADTAGEVGEQVKTVASNISNQLVDAWQVFKRDVEAAYERSSERKVDGSKE